MSSSLPTSVWARESLSPQLVLPDPGSCLLGRGETGKPDQVSGTLAVWLLGCKALWVTAMLSLPGPQFLLAQEAVK